MEYCYTATFEANDDKTRYYCRVPDLPGCIATVGNLDYAVEAIINAASRWLIAAEDEGRDIPAATPQDDLDIPLNATCSNIDINTTEYRDMWDGRRFLKEIDSLFDFQKKLYFSTLDSKAGIRNDFDYEKELKEAKKHAFILWNRYGRREFDFSDDKKFVESLRAFLNYMGD